MRFSVLGSAGSYNSPGSACSSYLVQQGDCSVLLDAGNGSMANLFDFCNPAELNAVVLSHEHADHWVDIVGVYHYRLLADSSGGEIPLLAPPSLLAALSRQLHADDFKGVFKPIPIDPSTEIEVEGLKLRFSRTNHPVETYAVSVTGQDSVIVYTADTGPDCEPLNQLVAEADLLVAECTWADQFTYSGPPLHMNPSSFTRLLDRSPATLAFATHVAHPQSRLEVLEEIRRLTDRNVELAIDRLSVEV